MSNADPKQPQRVLPTLTEVINDLPAGSPPPAAPRNEAEVVPEPLLAATMVEERRIVEQVIARLGPRIDVLFEHRLREALAPAMARLHSTLSDEVQKELGRTLRETVEQAVNEELARHRGA